MLHLETTRPGTMANSTEPGDEADASIQPMQPGLSCFLPPKRDREAVDTGVAAKRSECPIPRTSSPIRSVSPGRSAPRSTLYAGMNWHAACDPAGTMSTLARDLRYALRGLGRNRG